MLVLSPEENLKHIEKTSLYHYTYNWPATNALGKTFKTQAVVLGVGSMFNHSTYYQNVAWQRDVQKQVVVYRTLRDIKAGEELCKSQTTDCAASRTERRLNVSELGISYGGSLWFDDADAKSGSDVEDGDDVLGRIQLEF